MATVGDTVIYGSDGICKLTGVRKMGKGPDRRDYYVLKPVFECNSTIYIPVGDSKAEEKLRHLLTAEEIHALIRDMPGEEGVWIENENERKECYRQNLAGGDRTALVGMIKALYTHQRALKGKGRKLHASDERFLKDAERALYDEFAHVLGIEREEVLSFIFAQIEEDGGEI